MNVDLEQSLDRLARSVGDAVAAERLGGQVHRMVARIRRRRAARRTATGVVGVGAAAAVVVGGVQYLGRESAPQPPAEPTPDMLVVPVDACGMTLGQLGWTGVGPVGIEAVEGPPTGREDGGVTLATEVVKHDAVELRLDATAPRYVAVDPQTGLVTGVPDAGEPFPEPDWALAGERFGIDDEALQTFHVSASMPLRDCDAAPDDFGPDTLLTPGTYEIHAMQVVHPTETYQGLDTFVAVGGPWRIEVPALIGTDVDADLTPEERAADQIDAWLAAPVANPDWVMPVCGAEAALDDGMPALELDVLADPSALGEPGGTTVPDAVVLKTTEGRYAIGNASPTARLVLMVDGVVVGYQFLDSEDLVDVDLAFGETQPFPLRTTTTLCGTGEGGTGEALPLPPGEYTAIATLDLLVKEIGGPGEEPDGSTYPYTAVSEPVTVHLD